MTILAVAVEVAMVLLILGLSDGLVEESAHRRRGIGADIIIRASSSASTLTTGTNGLPESLIAEIETMPEVALAAGTTISLPTNLQTITGIDWDRFVRMANGVRFLQGGPFAGPDDVIIDSIYAQQTKPKIGGTLRGIIEGDSDPHVFLPELIAHHKAGRLPIERFTKIYPLDQINQAIDDAHHGRCVKAVLTIE